MMTSRFAASLCVTAIVLTACASAEVEIPQGVAALGDPAKPVRAVAETVVLTDVAVDADDPAFWADPRDPRRAMLFGTDKSDGLYVHDLNGTVRQFFPDGPMNNVDVRNGFRVDGREMVLVAATQRDRFGVMTWLMDPGTLEVRRYGHIATPADFGEPYGFCLGRRGDDFLLIPNNKDGLSLVIGVTAGAQGPVGVVERRLKVCSQTEGCVVDDAAGHLYVGEEDVGVWRFDLRAAASDGPVQVAAIDRHRLTDDVEGLTLMRDGGRTYLIASSQGDSTYPVWRLDGAREATAYVYMGRFAVVDGATADGRPVDGVTHTDGLDAWSGPIGPWPEGAIAFHDDSDTPGRGQQNYKIVDWRDVRMALGL